MKQKRRQFKILKEQYRFEIKSNGELGLSKFTFSNLIGGFASVLMATAMLNTRINIAVAGLQKSGVLGTNSQSKESWCSREAARG